MANFLQILDLAAGASKDLEHVYPQISIRNEKGSGMSIAQTSMNFQKFKLDNGVLESFQHMMYKSVLSVVSVYRRPSRLYLSEQIKEGIYDANYFTRNLGHLPFACVSLLEFFAKNGFIDFSILHLLSADHMTLGQLYAINSTICKQLCKNIWDFKSIYKLPLDYFPLIPSDAINELNDNEVVFNLLFKFNEVRDRLLTAQKARLVRKVMGVPLWKLVANCRNIKTSCVNILIPSEEILQLIPFNYFRKLNYAQLLPFIVNSPINSPQSMFFANMLLNSDDTISEDIQTNFKLVLTLTCDVIMKVKSLEVLTLLRMSSTLPKPYSHNYETVKCLFNKYVEYLNATYQVKNSSQEVLMSIATDDQHFTAGGLVLAHFSVSAWTSLPVARCVKLMKIVGKLSISSLLMVQPSYILNQLAVVALKCLGIRDILDEASLMVLGNLINYVSPKYIGNLSSQVFLAALSLLSGIDSEHQQIAVFMLPCHDDLLVHTINQKIIDEFGNTESWKTSEVVNVKCLLYTLNNAQLAAIKDKYLAENVDIVRLCWIGVQSTVDLLQLKVFYEGMCRLNLASFYYTRQLKIKNVIRRIQEAAFSETYRAKRSVEVHPTWLSQFLNQDKVKSWNGPCNDLCPAIQDFGSMEFWNESQIDKLNEDEFVNCLDFMGARILPEKIATRLWRRLIKVLGPAEALDKNKLMQLGSLVRAIPAAHVAKLNLNDADVLGEFGRVDLWTRQDMIKLKAMASRVRQQYKRPINAYTAWDFMILGQISCGFPLQDLQRICNLTFADGLEIFSQLDCSSEVMQVLARKIVNINLFGAVSNWSAEALNAAGTILGGFSIEELQQIPACAFFGISTRAALALPISKFNDLTIQQLSFFPPQVVASLQLFGIVDQLNLRTKLTLQLASYNERLNLRIIISVPPR